MAITDLLTRIGSDAADEGGKIVGAAESEAALILSAAEATLATERAAALQAAERDGAEEAGMILANARLATRDALLAEKRALAERVLERAIEALEAMPDDAYLDLIARAVGRAAVGGETLTVAPADAKRLSGLGARLAADGVSVSVTSGAAPLDHGVLLTGDRIRVEVSPAALVSDRRDELLLVAARELFGGTE